MTTASLNTDRPSVRRQLVAKLRTDAELESFCLDNFPQTQKLFTRGMNRIEKVNLLIEREDVADLVEAIRQYTGHPFGLKAASHIGVLWVGLTVVGVGAAAGGWALATRYRDTNVPAIGTPQVDAAGVSAEHEEAGRPQLVPWKIAGLLRGPRNEPLVGIQVSLPTMGLCAVTDTLGHFVMSGEAEHSELDTPVLLRAESVPTGSVRFRAREQHVYRGSTELIVRLEKER